MLSAERGEQSIADRRRADRVALLDAMASFSSGVGLIPEQDWELPDLAASPFGTDPTIASIGFENGKPAGSASPLTWSAGVVRAPVRRHRRRPAGRPAGEHRGPLRHAHPGPDHAHRHRAGRPLVGLRLAGDRHRHDRPGNTVDVLATNTDHNSSTDLGHHDRAADGSFTVDVPVTGGTTVLNVVATAADGATAHATRTVVFDFVPGTVLLDVTDPTTTTTGRATTPTRRRANFHAGAFDMQRFQVVDDGTNIIFRVQTRDLIADLRQPARRAAGRRVRPRPGGELDVDRGVVPAAQLPDRAEARPGAS